MIVDATIGKRTWRIEIAGSGEARVLKVDGRTLSWSVAGTGPALHLLLDGRGHDVGVVIEADGFRVTTASGSFSVVVEPVHAGAAASGAATVSRKVPSAKAPVRAPMPGKIVRLLVAEGAVVAKGAGLLVIEAMKMENEIRSPRAGTVSGLAVREGQAVEAGAALCVLS